MIGEMALAIVLLAGAGLMLRTFLKIYTADLGVRTANILTASVRLPAARYPGPQAPCASSATMSTAVFAVFEAPDAP